MAITQRQLKEILHYCPKTGVFTWRHRSAGMFPSEQHQRSWNARCAGKVAGSVNGAGYRAITLRQVQRSPLLEHRLAWLYVHGRLPRAHIDHINGNRADNRITNLREVSRAENQKNMRRFKTNKSGVPGVHWDRLCGKWRVRVARKHIGVYSRIEQAIQAREKAAREHGYHKNHGRAA